MRHRRYRHQPEIVMERTNLTVEVSWQEDSLLIPVPGLLAGSDSTLQSILADDLNIEPLGQDLDIKIYYFSK